MEPQHGRYYQQQAASEPKVAPNASPSMASQQVSGIPVFMAENPKRRVVDTRRDFLDRKYEDDLRNARVWRRFTFVASATGVAVIFLVLQL